MGCCFSILKKRTKEFPISSSTSQDCPVHPHHHHAQPRPATPSKPATPPRFSHIGQILGKPYIDITTLYDMHKELGKGLYGITYLCTEKATGLQYACKSIPVRKIVGNQDIQDVRMEIMILQHLTGQPNIVEFKGAYEDKNYVHLVMEFCSGGELFGRITEKGSYSEKEAARIGRQIVNVVKACHFMGVMHRDLKPEHFLMVNRDENSPIKATGFGLSVFIEQGQFLHTSRSLYSFIHICLLPKTQIKIINEAQT